MCVVWYVCLFGVLRENALCAHDITYAGHYEKSLCSDNDPCCYPRGMKIISSDWIALLRRLLIRCRVTHMKVSPEVDQYATCLLLPPPPPITVLSICMLLNKAGIYSYLSMNRNKYHRPG